MATKTITIPTFSRDLKTGAHTQDSVEINGEVFTGTIGAMTRDFIIHKDVNKTQKKYVLTDVKTGNRVGYLEATTKKAATPEAARDLLFILKEKHGAERLEQVFQNADLKACLEPQIKPNF